ncbi:TetR/AcrR family transcriptional regulator [Nocardia sp. NPDC101769]|uniref:TetR/AcrR family transcriptional regulator n=1 Tax=Nocardia sp. NPDC101769 TaxID=3364333 RepID=UPI0038122477
MGTTTEIPVIGRRERNRQRVRARIYTSALELFAEKGYDATTIDEIAERADMSRGTFFNHFPRKEDLITEWARDRRRTLMDRIEQPPGTDADDTGALLHLCMSGLTQLSEAQRRVTEIMLTAWVKTGGPLTEEPCTAEVFARIIEIGVRRGDIDSRVDPVLLGNLLRDAYLGVVYRWARRTTDPGRIAGELRDVLDVILRGVAARTATPEVR